ncbi:DUF983 domain-containing protein [Flavobacterium aurantiibacter]|uniref:DUF983 domain-containing protein n=2 Tax=Flavobacteriaceae TaxID=49546 RepID=A0A255ZJ20_9FLAO|nr:DUF983 domain-containing protein [Flavobacterium aurantiibacter]
MLKKGTKLYSILTGTCPRCHSESMYENKNPYIVTETMHMHDTCSHCGLRYKMEPNFFFGAMYVSYALAVAVGVAAFIISFVFVGCTVKEAFITIIAALVVLMPWIVRMSRNIYINFFIAYKDDAIASKNA